MGTLRLLLALSVVLFHSGPFVFTGSDWVGGIVAVEGFFVVSGFYMTLVLHQRYGGRLRDFCVRRGMMHMTLDTSTDMNTLLMDYLRKRGLLK